jgi:hypothetical protein
MAHSSNETIKRVEHDHPGWMVWVVYRAVGSPVWCARRHDDHDAAHTINAATPDRLERAIREQERQPG